MLIPIEKPKKRKASVGDVVLVTEGEIDRREWKLARIIKVHPSGDDVARIVDLKLGNGSVKYNRAVGNLAFLDVEKCGESSEK